MKLISLILLLFSFEITFAQSENLDTLLQQGTEYCQSGQLVKGMEILYKVKEEYRQQENWYKYSEAAISYWFAHYQVHGNVDTAVAALEWMQDKVAKTLPDSLELRADIHLYKSIMYYYQTDYEESLNESEKALAFYEKDRKKHLEAIGGIYNNLGVLASSQGMDKKAEIYFLKSVEIKSEFDEQGIPYSAQSMVYNYLNLASLYYFKGDYVKFLNYQRLLEDKLDEAPEENMVRSRLTKNYLRYYLRDEKDLLKAKQYLDDLVSHEKTFDLDFFNKLGNRQLEAEYYLKVGDTAKAESIHIAKTKKAEKLMQDEINLLEFYTSISEFYAEIKQYDNALSWNEKSENLVAPFVDAPLKSLENVKLDQLAIVYGAKVAIYYLAKKQNEQNRSSILKEYGEKYMDILTEFASRIDELGVNQTFIDFDVVLAALMEVNTTEGNVYDAMELIELKQSLPLLKSRKDIATVQRYQVDKSLLKAYKQTGAELSTLRKKYVSSNEDVSNDSIAKLIFATSQKRDSLNTEIKNAIESKGGQVLGALDTEISKEIVSQQHTEDECILHFFHHYEDLYILIKSNETEKALVINDVEQIDENIAGLRNTLTDPTLWDRDTFDRYAKELYQKIINPISTYIQDKNLAIVPSGVFNYLPFEVLLHPTEDKYLIENHAIRYIYSIKDLSQNGTEVNETKRIAFAPNFGNDANKAYAVRQGYDALAGAEKETNMLAELFDFNLYKGAEATKANFLETIEDARFIHLASHAQLDEFDPMQSYIVFDNADSLSEEKQRLYAYELYNMSLDADLAVLSACNTGMGKQKKFNGVISLARAFQFAGVRSTIMSLWPAQDESTAKIMELFYKHLSEGESKSIALQQAKLDYLKTADNIHSQPFYWAPFILQGNNDPVPMNKGKWLYLALGAFVLGATAIYFWRRKSSASSA